MTCDASAQDAASQDATSQDALSRDVAEIIAVCDGDPVAALGALYVAYKLLEEETSRLRSQVSRGYRRRPVRPTEAKVPPST